MWLFIQTKNLAKRGLVKWILIFKSHFNLLSSNCSKILCLTADKMDFNLLKSHLNPSRFYNLVHFIGKRWTLQVYPWKFNGTKVLHTNYSVVVCVWTGSWCRKEVFKDAEVHISRDINDKELEQAVRFLHDNGQVMCSVAHMTLSLPAHHRNSTTLRGYCVEWLLLCGPSMAVWPSGAHSDRTTDKPFCKGW